MTLAQIESIIRSDRYGGAWWLLFKKTDTGHLFFPTGATITPEAYAHILGKFGVKPATDEQPLTAEERRVNALRYRAMRYS